MQGIVFTVPSMDDENDIVRYTGNGIQTFFEFMFIMDEDSELLVLVDQVLRTDFQQQTNGIRFFAPPPFGAAIIITRITEVSQLRNWVPFDQFPADKTEKALDKLIILKREATNWRAALNLFAIRNIGDVTISNSAGADAVIPIWHTIEDEAGVFNGIMTDQAPPDGADVLEPAGFVWFQPEADTPPPPVTTQFSSALYPVDAFDEMDSSSVVASARHWTHDWPQMLVTPSVVGGQLVVTIKYGTFTAPPELLDSSSAVLSGNIVVVIKYGAFTSPVESMDSSSAVLSGLLKIVVNYIAFTAEPSFMESSSVVASGSLTTYTPPP